ncbi:ABC transporter permease [Xanthomonas campestris pv. raphani]|uniref:Transport permease protein n=2 Tax=Xanthomonas campestris TaxID=339 RepID=Q8PCV2_XANCP|nr:membrane subunit of LPS efflux transporter [Xanthomonas campestris pv. campestris str. ATCC 33913]RFF68977.1 ABC transporter permease [Xanthomonas campestris pv. raphani]
MDMIRSVWAFRYFILSSIRNDLRLRFLRSKLGALWMIIHPLMQVLIFATILSEVLAAKLPGVNNKFAYALYLMAGTLCWSMFAESIGKCASLFVDNGNLMKKQAFPRICLPLIAGGTVMVNNLLLFLAIIVVFAILGHSLGPQAGWLPLLMLLTLAFAMSIGLLLGIFNVFVRDIGQVVPVVLQAMFWVTPIVYTIDILPQQTRDLFKLNPLFPLVSAYQGVLLYGRAPDWMSLLPLTAATAVLGFVSLVVFRRASAEMVDAL